jgi:hypothetical protein
VFYPTFFLEQQLIQRNNSFMLGSGRGAADRGELCEVAEAIGKEVTV